jgi:nuclear transport factor 2 (NTF2) superfamily protein
MAVRHASTNGLAIDEHDRTFLRPLGHRPDGYPALSDLAL